MTKVTSPTAPATSPTPADARPRRAPSDVRIRNRERAPDQMANGAKIPNHIPRRPRTSARVAPRSRVLRSSIISSPERTVRQKQIKDGADAPQERDDDPYQLLHAAHVGASDDVDDAEDPGQGMEKDRQQNFDEKLHRPIACPRNERGAGPAPRLLPNNEYRRRYETSAQVMFPPPTLGVSPPLPASRTPLVPTCPPPWLRPSRTCLPSCRQPWWCWRSSQRCLRLRSPSSPRRPRWRRWRCTWCRELPIQPWTRSCSMRWRSRIGRVRHSVRGDRFPARRTRPRPHASPSS